MKTAASVEYNNETKKCITVVLVCYTTLMLNLIIVMNQTIVHRTLIVSNDL